ncbi:MAG: HAD family hydrolase [Actinobacteria bacterium]|uniref:HAD family hydrolase n=1 Tax=Candidatus Fonsibacter lacus TaxID=2576439 RepID=A0A965LKR3_9PROT|nr:HAD family hydrolase [Candidatus Fonsibacter lacus]
MMEKIEMVAFDVAGTTLRDDGTVMEAFRIALTETQPKLWRIHGQEWMRFAADTMGQSKIEVFSALLGDGVRARSANAAFERAYIGQLAGGGITPIPGAEETFRTLREQGIPIVLTTGFNRHTFDTIIDHIGWHDLIDFAITPSEVERGRPHPDMLIAAQQRLGFRDPRNSVIVGDTASDMLAGVAFGATKIFGVLTGAHDKKMLYETGATSVVNSVANLITQL